jgi:hypothetical protein
LKPIVPKKKSNNPVERIQVSKNDEIALIVERIIDSGAEEVILTIPRFSKLAESSANFHLIKRESDLLNKRIVVESVDDKVIDFCQAVDLESLNPVLVKKRHISDIVSAPAPAREEASAEPTQKISKKTETQDLATKKEKKKLTINFSKSKSLSPIGQTDEISKPKRTPVRRRSIISAILGVVVVVLASFIFRVIPKVDIEITTTKTPWEFNDKITLNKSEGNTQVFSDTRNLSATYPASGVEKINRYAKGFIKVYNAYSSEAQPLVRRTRFVTPDGKIFRLTEAITVPPAKVVEGRIIPSSIEAEVIADEAGEDFNVGPVSNYTIPGFKGTAKYEGFYGSSEGSMKGGFVGEAAVPTDEDVLKAKENISIRIEDVVSSSLLSSLPGDFKIIAGATDFQITKQNVITETDNQGNFSVFAEAEMDIVAFKEADVLEILIGKMKDDLGEDYEFNSISINYGDAVTNFDTGQLTFLVEVSALSYRPVDTETLRNRILGQREEDLRVTISSLPGFEDGKVSFWPFWVKAVPSRPSRVGIDII